MTAEILERISKNENFKDKSLLTDLTILLADRKEAHEFLYLYGEYGEVVDDLVDDPGNPDNVEKAARLAHVVNNCAYWNKYKQCLYLVERLIHNTYFDSVKWESADEEWKRRDAKALSHCGYNMLFAVILLEFGEEKLKELSLRFREHAHERHIHDPI
jgi:hypothetical protein